MITGGITGKVVMKMTEYRLNSHILMGIILPMNMFVSTGFSLAHAQTNQKTFDKVVGLT